jgi:ankyrin repeat protein
MIKMLNQCCPSITIAVVVHCTNCFNNFISDGNNINEKDNSGLTPLHHAIFSQSLDYIKILIDHGAYIDDKNIYGYTPLYFASLNGHTNIVEYLVNHGADTSIIYEHGVTASDIAINPTIKSLINSVNNY